MANAFMRLRIKYRWSEALGEGEAHMKTDITWNGIIVPAGQKDESKHQTAPSRVAYVDNVFMAGI